MDSHEYFAKAEKSDRTYRRIMVFIGLFITTFLCITVAVLFKINTTNHANAVDTLNTITENEIKLNTNLTNSIHCILLLNQQTYTPTNINRCFAPAMKLTPPVHA